MTRVRVVAIILYAAAVLAGTLTDVPRRQAPASPARLIGDFHVHAMPGDGFLPVWEIQKEAARRGIDVVAITNHNHNLAWRIAQSLGLLAEYPLVIPGQELTTPTFHMAVVGVTSMVDSRLSAREALDAIHAQGGVGIAAHPFAKSWTDTDVEALRRLDGAEVGHPSIAMRASWDAELRAFYERARRENPRVAAIGSSDFHGGQLGRYCTALDVPEPTARGVVDAIRGGRTTAYGAPSPPCPAVAADRGLHTAIALAGLLALAVLITPRRRRN